MTSQSSEDGELKDRLTKLISQDGWVDTQEVDVEGQVAAIQSIIRTEKLKLLAELDKSMPTAEQLTTKYGYHMPDKQYGYKLALHDIREVIGKLEAEL